MALVLKDRVRETSTTTGTGTLTLAGAVAGFQSFSAIGTGNTTYYTIVASTDWEVGIGTWTSPDQLSRDTVLASTNAGALVPFGAGSKDVFLTFPAEGFASPPAIGGTTPAAVTGTTVSAKVQFLLPTATIGNAGFGYIKLLDGGDGFDYLEISGEDGSGGLMPMFMNGGIVVKANQGTSYSGWVNLMGLNTGLTQLKAPDDGNVVVLEMPASAGADGQVLTTNGGTPAALSWTYTQVGNTPVTITTATYTVAATDSWLIANRAGTVTLTLPTASTNNGRILTVKNVQAQTVVSATGNVVPIGGTAAGTPILAASAGKFATLVSDGTNWIIMQAN